MTHTGKGFKTLIIATACVIAAGAGCVETKADDSRINEEAIGTVKIIEDEPVPVSGKLHMAASVADAKKEVLGVNREQKEADIIWYPAAVLVLAGGGVMKVLKNRNGRYEVKCR